MNVAVKPDLKALERLTKDDERWFKRNPDRSIRWRFAEGCEIEQMEDATRQAIDLPLPISTCVISMFPGARMRKFVCCDHDVSALSEKESWELFYHLERGGRKLQ